MSIDRTPKPCLHKRADHQHGTYACYTLDGCRCLPCGYATSIYYQQLNRRNAYGRSNYVDADPARAQVAALMAAGVGLKRIVATSGVSQGVLWKLVYGKNGGTPSRRVTRATADRLLALDPTNPALLADGARTNSTGTRRRLQALACLGWSVNRLSAESGIDRQPLDKALRGGLITAGHARAVAALYERLWNQPASAEDHRSRISVARAKGRAERESWPPPLAWDDDTIDDLTATPTVLEDQDAVDELAVDAVCDGHTMRLTGATLLAAVHRMHAAGYPVDLIAARVGIHPRQVDRLRLRETPPRPRRAAA